MLLEQASEGLRLQLLAEDESEATLDRARPKRAPSSSLVDSLILGAIEQRA